MKNLFYWLVNISFFIFVSLLVFIYVFEENVISELLSHFLFFYFLISIFYVIFYLFTKKGMLLGAACVLCALGAWGWASLLIPEREIRESFQGEEVSLYVLNIWYKIQNVEKVLKQIEEKKFPQMVVIQEATPALVEALSSLKSIYPHIFQAPQEGSRGVVIFSKIPIVRAQRVGFSCTRNHYTILECLTPQNKRPFVVVELHASSPGGDFEMTQRCAELEEMVQVIASLPQEHKILVGDLNTTPYSAYFKNLMAGSRLKNAMQGFRSQGTWPTYAPSFLRIPLDHVLLTSALCVSQQEVCSCVGSDHLPVLTHIKIPIH
jgi:endonuclease/exonuclease/phosphatase (EEP) superfamily protein YafD